MLAHKKAGCFEEWLAEQKRERRPWSLQGALYDWLYDEAVGWSAKSHAVFLQMVVIIVVEWHARPERFYCENFDGKEIVLADLSDDSHDGRNRQWECLQRDHYDQAVLDWEYKTARR